jgi:hypothetical protein
MLLAIIPEHSHATLDSIPFPSDTDLHCSSNICARQVWPAQESLVLRPQDQHTLEGDDIIHIHSTQCLRDEAVISSDFVLRAANLYDGKHVLLLPLVGRSHTLGQACEDGGQFFLLGMFYRCCTVPELPSGDRLPQVRDSRVWEVDVEGWHQHRKEVHALLLRFQSSCIAASLDSDGDSPR